MKVTVTSASASQAWKLYWTDVGADKIQRSNLDGSRVETLVTLGTAPAELEGIALDMSGGKMYWTTWSRAKIQRSNLDGSGVEDLVTPRGLPRPYGIALDVSGGQMYWTDRRGKIQRGNLDGSGVEDLVTIGLDSPSGIALDVPGGKMYWTDWGARKIQRSNLDGSGVEDLVILLKGPWGIALDIAGGKMYWAEWAHKIQRSNLDGSRVEDLVTGLSNRLSGIALDLSGGKMYWTDYSKGKIQRSNLDGSGVEDLVRGLGEPKGIALGAVEAGPPDLVVEASVGEILPTPGSSFTLSATVRNEGEGQAVATTLRYYRSDDSTIDSTDTQLGTAAVNSLASLATRAYSIDLTAPTSTGTYFYGACVESVAGESNADNNCSSALLTVVEAGPDLVVRTSVDDNTLTRLTPGQSFRLRATVHNRGTASAAATTLRYYRSSDLAISTNDTEVGTDGVGTLSAGATSDESTRLNAPSDTGTYYYGACVDNVGSESNTDNNCSTAVTVIVEREYTRSRSFSANFSYDSNWQSVSYRIASSDIDDGLRVSNVKVAIQSETERPSGRTHVREVTFSYTLRVSSTIPPNTTLRARIVYEILVSDSAGSYVVRTYTVSLEVITGDTEASELVRVQDVQ